MSSSLAESVADTPLTNTSRSQNANHCDKGLFRGKINEKQKEFIAKTLIEICKKSHGSNTEKHLQKVAQEEFEQEFHFQIPLEIIAKEVRNIKLTKKSVEKSLSSYKDDEAKFLQTKQKLEENVDKPCLARSRKRYYEETLKHLTPPKPITLNNLTEMRRRAALHLTKNKRFKEIDSQFRQEFTEISRSDSGLKIRLKRSLVLDEEKKYIPASDVQEDVDKENKAPEKITRKALVTRTAAIVQEQKQKLDELVMVKIEAGKALKRLASDTIKFNEKQLQLKESDTESMKQLVQMIGNLVQSTASATNASVVANTNSFNSI